jgi:hypothetical protein
MTDLNTTEPVGTAIPRWSLEPAYLVEVQLERARWEEIESLTLMLTDAERHMPGYFVDPDWSITDMIGHFGMWFVEGRRRLLDIAAHDYVPRAIDIDASNAATLREVHDQSWDAVWSRTSNARIWMLEAWLELRQPDEAASEWIRKAGAEHYGEHLPRLRAWVAALMALRAAPPADERDP